jgi:hypothetical protein
MTKRASQALALVVALAGACGDDGRTETFSGSLSADALGIRGRHRFEAERDAALTITLVEVACPGSDSPELSVLASQNGVTFLSGYLRAGESSSQPNGSHGGYDIEVCMGRFRYPGGCRYTISVSQ